MRCSITALEEGAQNEVPGKLLSLGSNAVKCTSSEKQTLVFFVKVQCTLLSNADGLCSPAFCCTAEQSACNAAPMPPQHKRAMWSLRIEPRDVVVIVFNQRAVVLHGVPFIVAGDWKTEQIFNWTWVTNNLWHSNLLKFEQVLHFFHNLLKFGQVLYFLECLDHLYKKYGWHCKHR